MSHKRRQGSFIAGEIDNEYKIKKKYEERVEDKKKKEEQNSIK